MDDTRDKANDEEWEKEIAELGASLDKFTVKYPGEPDISAAIDRLREYVPAKPTAPGVVELLGRLAERRGLRLIGWRRLLQQAYSDLAVVSRWYWLSSFLLFSIGCLCAVYMEADPYRTIVLLAPVPVLAGIMELFKAREHGVLEMELACRYSASQLLLSRLLLIILYNIGLNILLTGFLLFFSEGPVPGKLILSWLTPLAVVTAISLWLTTWFRGGVLLTAGLTLWTAIALALLSVPQAMEILERFNAGVCILLIAASMAAGLFRLRKIADKYDLFETGEGYAADH